MLSHCRCIMGVSQCPKGVCPGQVSLGDTWWPSSPAFCLHIWLRIATLVVESLCATDAALAPTEGMPSLPQPAVSSPVNGYPGMPRPREES